MESNYICPHCKSNLKPNKHIVFSVHAEADKKGLIMLSPQIGNYEIIHDQDSTGIIAGDKLKVYCPVCFERLGVDDVDENLAMIEIIDQDGNRSKLYFSKIVGEKATYKITGDDVERFGENHEAYNYWGVSANY